VRLLLDTHILLWWLSDQERLSERAAKAIADGKSNVVVSVATLWELSIKQSTGRLRIQGELREHLAMQAFSELSVCSNHAYAVRDLPPHHRDPFDRLLVAQAQCEGLTLVTADRQLAAYDVTILWADK
jgi:PIN domain nuclease of toxin-antitoxin system